MIRRTLCSYSLRASRALDLPPFDLAVYRQWLLANDVRFDGVDLAVDKSASCGHVLRATRDLPPNFICAVVPRKLRLDVFHDHIGTSIRDEIYDALVDLKETIPAPVLRAFPGRASVLSTLPPSAASLSTNPFAQPSVATIERIQSTMEAPLPLILNAIDAAVAVLADVDADGVFVPWVASWPDSVPTFPPTPEWAHFVAGVDATVAASTVVPPDTPPPTPSSPSSRAVLPDAAFGASVRVPAGPATRVGARRAYPLYAANSAAAAVALAESYDAAWNAVCEALPTRVVAAFPYSTEALRWAVWALLAQSYAASGLYGPLTHAVPARCPVVDALPVAVDAAALAAWPAPDDSLPVPATAVANGRAALGGIGALITTRRGVAAGENLTIPPARGRASWPQRLVMGGPTAVPDMADGSDRDAAPAAGPRLTAAQRGGGPTPQEVADAVAMWGPSVVERKDRSGGKKRIVVDATRMLRGCADAAM